MKKIIFLLLTILVVSILNANWISISNNEILFEHNSTDKANTKVFFTLNGYEEKSITVDNKNYKHITYWNEGEFIEEGKPALPRFSRLIAIPNSGNPHFEIISYDRKIVKNIDVYPAQRLQSESQSSDRNFVIDEEFYNGSKIFPAEIVQLGEPAIMRDLRIVRLTINPFQYDPAKRELHIIKNIEVNIETDEKGGINRKTLEHAPSRSFQSLYQSTVLNYKSIETREENQHPSYLYIYPNDTSVEDNLQYLIDWKRQKGFDVYAASTFETGTSHSSIKNFIQDAYDNWLNPPEFVCLVGDAEGPYTIPADNNGDHNYTRLDGTDILADVFIGRLSFDTIIEFQTIIAKILGYEKEPFLQNTDWYDEVVLIGDPSSSGTSTVDTKQHIKNMMMNTAPNLNYTENYISGYSGTMTNSLNSGVSYFNYRGYMGMSGFDINNILALNNGFMLPFAVFLTCGTGTFASTWDEARSEVFLKAGNPSNPKGAIGAIGTATTSTHTCFNNSVDSGIFYGLFAEGIKHQGGALNRGKLNLYLNYPQNPGGAVNNFSDWNNLMGDPAIDLWTAVPQPMQVTYQNQVSTGANYLEVTVIDDEGYPIEDAWVTALQGDDEIFSSDFTDENGMLYLPLNAQNSGTVQLTVTKHNFIPHLGSFEIAGQPRFVNVESYLIDDDNSGTSSGNDDGLINSGETIEIPVQLKNFGSQTANSVTAQITTPNDFIQINDDTEDFGNIAAGSSQFSDDDFDIVVDPDVLGGMTIQLNMQISDAAGNIWNDVLYLPVKGANLLATDYVVDDPNNMIDPGETVDIEVTIENLGDIDVNLIYGTLSSLDNKLIIVDDEGYFGTIPIGGQSSNAGDPFTLTAETQIIPGSQFTLELNLYNNDGYDQTVTFPVYVGEVSITDPLGPDAYGYYIYDDGDTDYYNVPVYDWIEISSLGTNLNLNDPGNTGDVINIDLPIVFKFYGEEYNTLAVCSNGWVAPGYSEDTSFMNWKIPAPMGPSPMIAPFWDDLKTGNVYSYYDNASHSFIIQWDNMHNEYNDSEETFQLILYDANYYPTATADSEIKFQYKVINNIDQGSYPSQHGQFATVGIEDHSGLIGLEYTFNNTYPLPAKTLEDEMALLITGPPVSFVEPFIVMGGVVINDVNGNNNGQLDYAEDAGLQVQLNNLGDNPATDVSATISTSDPYLTITNDTADYGDIGGGGAGINLSDYEVTIAEDCPDEHVVGIDIVVTSNENTWELNFTVELNAPIMELLSVLVDDGDNNILDPGETADVLVSFENIGGADLYNSIVELTENDQHITLNNATYDFGLFGGNTIGTGIFNITVDNAAPVGHNAFIDWELTGDYNYSFSDQFILAISQIPVMINTDFSGTWPPDGWSVTSSSGQINWEQSSSSSAGGNSPEAEFSWSPSTVATQRLVTDPINTLGSNTLDLEFRHMINDFSGDYNLRVETTSDGNNWNTVVEFPDNDYPATLENITVETDDVGSQNFQLAFTFDGNSYNINYWYVDDVTIESGSPQGVGYIEGNVSLDGGSGNIEDVLISAENYQTHPNSNGDYLIPVLPGDYNVSANLTGYSSQTVENVTVQQNETVTIDFVLQPLSNPQNLAATISTNDVTLNWEMGLDLIRTTRITPKRSRLLRSKRENSMNRALTGFKVFRDEFEIAQINDPNTMTYDDFGLAPNDYEYYVVAVYDNSLLSEPSNTVEVQIELAPPTDLAAISQGFDILLGWTAPAGTIRSFDGYKVYQNDEFIAETTETSYLDENVTSGNYNYYVTAMYSGYESDPSNTYTIEHTDATNTNVPIKTELLDNIPNPFNPTTKIRFALKTKEFVNIEIFNIKGKKVRTLVNSELEAGLHSIVWNGIDDDQRKIASGIYFYRMKTSQQHETKKMLLLK